MPDPKAELNRWLSENPHPPPGWAVVAARLRDHPEMAFAWPTLIDAGARPIRVFGMVTNCLREAASDTRRAPSKAEKDALDEVRKHARALLAALQGAQLLDEGAPLIDLGGHPYLAAWTDNRAALSDGFGLPVASLPGLLRLLESECAERIESPPARALERATDSPEWTYQRAFCRRLAARFTAEYGAAMPESVARVATAVLQFKDLSITGRDVAKFLKDSPWN